MDRLISLINKLNNPSVVGLDTRLSYIPQYIKKTALKEFGNSPTAAAFAITVFNKKIIDSIKDLVPAVKIQMACYEKFGPSGIKALEETAKYAKESGLYVIFDGKRNDIKSSMECYSNAYLGQTELFDGKKYSAFCCDSLTVNAYCGRDTIDAVLQDCEEFDKTIFVLLKTSNSSSSNIQDIKTKSKTTIFEEMGRLCENLGKTTIGSFGYSKIGAVVGATHKKELESLRNIFKNTFFLIPGYGAQGATAKDVSKAFKNKIGGIVNSSRQILTAWQKNNAKEELFAEEARKEAEKMKQDLNMAI